MKIFGIGMHKTGTKTLGKCLTAMGFNVLSWNDDVFDLWAEGGPEALLPIVEKYDTFEDWPWTFCYETLAAHFPDAKFILTVRKNSEIWYDSLCRHAKIIASSRHMKRVYGYHMPHDFREEHIRFYETHNRNVRDFFAARNSDLLEVCWENGDGWPQLVKFVDRPIPLMPFPHENKG